MSPVLIQSLPAGGAEASRLGARLGIAVGEIAVHRFPDGEIRVTTAPAGTTTIIYGALDDPNDKLIALMFAADALRRNGARRLVLVAPYLCYMRQDKAFHVGEAVSQAVIGRLLGGAFDRLITVNAHLHRTSSLRDVFSGREVENLSAVPAIAATLNAHGVDRTTVLLGPDEESEPLVRELAAQLGLRSTIAGKTRRGDQSVQIALQEPALFDGSPVLLVDDILSSGGTLMACAEATRAAGASVIDAVVVHALCSPDVLGALARSGIRSVRSTTSVPHSTNTIRLDEILAAALRREISAAPSRQSAD